MKKQVGWKDMVEWKWSSGEKYERSQRRPINLQDKKITENDLEKNIEKTENLAFQQALLSENDLWSLEEQQVFVNPEKPMNKIYEKIFNNIIKNIKNNKELSKEDFDFIESSTCQQKMVIIREYNKKQNENCIQAMKKSEDLLEHFEQNYKHKSFVQKKLQLEK